MFSLHPIITCISSICVSKSVLTAVARINYNFLPSRIICENVVSHSVVLLHRINIDSSHFFRAAALYCGPSVLSSFCVTTLLIHSANKCKRISVVSVNGEKHIFLRERINSDLKVSDTLTPLFISLHFFVACSEIVLLFHWKWKTILSLT